MAETLIVSFLDWLRAHCDKGERLLVDDLDRPPRWFFEQGSSAYAEDFFARTGRWSAWRLALVAGLRRRLVDADHLVSAAEELFASERLLRFRIRLVRDSDQACEVDLTDRDWYLDTTGWTSLRQLLLHGREEPTWIVVRQNIKRDLERFRRMVEEQRDELVIAGEPRSPKLQDALSRLAELSYVNVGLVKTDILAAEAHFRAGHAKDVGSAFRRAIEQVVRDAHAEALSRSGAAPAATPPNMRDQTTEVGRVVATKASAHHAYGVYALLSELGSHAGPCDQDELEATWHAAVSALLILARRLRP